jgi:ribonucleoside-diphosphate reductase subunit M2
MTFAQAASAMESLKMESPIKKPQFEAEADKENIEEKYASDLVAVPIKGIPEMPEEEVVASTATSGKEDLEDEPILQENGQRFVLFPIKYHEVRRKISTARRVHACVW